MDLHISKIDAHIVSRYASQCATAHYDRIVKERREQPDKHDIERIIEESVLEALDYHCQHYHDALEHFNGKPLLLF